MMKLSTILALTLAASMASLAAALVSQYGFGLKPCHLCIAQRIPYAVVIALALCGFMKPRFQGAVVALIALAFLVDSGIASYHTAVEKHWVEGPTSCTTGESSANQSVEDFLKRIQNAPVVACDQPQWEYKGITMAGMNALWSLSLAFATFVSLRQTRKKENSDA